VESRSGSRIPQDLAKRAKAAAGFVLLARFRASRGPNALRMVKYGTANRDPTPPMPNFDAHPRER